MNRCSDELQICKQGLSFAASPTTINTHDMTWERITSVLELLGSNNNPAFKGMHQCLGFFIMSAKETVRPVQIG